MATNKAFDNYSLRIAGGNTGRVALVLCFSGSTFVGRIDFYPDGAPLPQDFLWHPGTTTYVVLQMPMSRFDALMSTLRLEKPLHLYIDVDKGFGAFTPGHGYLATTDQEPTGEQEGIP
jgi:hypothetical protein